MKVMLAVAVVGEEVVAVIVTWQLQWWGGGGGEDGGGGGGVDVVWCQTEHSLKALTCWNFKNIPQSFPCTNIP